MGSLSIWHWIVVIAVVLLLFGRGKISDLMGDVAQGIPLGVVLGNEGGGHDLMYGFPEAAGPRTCPTSPATAKIVTT